VFRRAALSAEPSGKVDLLAIGAEIDRTWRLAQATIPVILPGYGGAIEFGVAIGGMRDGFCSRGGMAFRFEGLPFSPRNKRTSFSRWFVFPSALDAYDVVSTVLVAALRSLGYANVQTGITEVAFRAPFGDSLQAAPPPGAGQ
jgi:hypothetical protein